MILSSTLSNIQFMDGPSCVFVLLATSTDGIAVSVRVVEWLTDAPRGADDSSGRTDLDLATLSE